MNTFGTLGDAEPVLARRLLRDAVHVLALVAGSRAEPLGHEPAIRLRLAGPKSAPLTIRNTNRSISSWMICSWATPGTSMAKFSVSEMPETSSPRGGDHVIGIAALDRFQQGQAAAAEHGLLGPDRHVADLVADHRHGAVGQVGDDDRAGSPGRTGRPSRSSST